MARVVTNLSNGGRFSGENYIWDSLTDGSYSSFTNPLLLQGTQEATQFAKKQQQPEQKGKAWDFLNNLLDFGKNIVGGRNQSTNVQIPAPPPPPTSKGIGTLGWVAIAAGVGVLGFVIYKAVKK